MVENCGSLDEIVKDDEEISFVGFVSRNEYLEEALLERERATHMVVATLPKKGCIIALHFPASKVKRGWRRNRGVPPTPW